MSDNLITMKKHVKNISKSHCYEKHIKNISSQPPYTVMVTSVRPPYTVMVTSVHLAGSLTLAVDPQNMSVEIVRTIYVVLEKPGQSLIFSHLFSPRVVQDIYYAHVKTLRIGDYHTLTRSLAG